VRRPPFPGVFEPHRDSLMLAACLQREDLGRGSDVLDLGSGSGVLAIAAARRGVNVTAVDISALAMMAIRLNARLNGVKLSARRGNLFDPVRGRQFDLIVSNPPYLPSVSERLPRHGPSRAWEGGPSGRAFIDQICAQASQHLTRNGVLLLVHSSLCGEGATVEALKRHGLETEVIARHRGPLGVRGRSRAAMLRKRGLLSQGDCEELVVFRARRTAQRA
jgi:release factor glutamine methyltransferase